MPGKLAGAAAATCSRPSKSPCGLSKTRARPGCLRAGGDAHRVQAFGYPRAPARGGEQVVAAQLTAVVESENVVGSVAPRAGRVHAQEQLDAVAAQHLAERLAQRRGLAGSPGARCLGRTSAGY
jgi:hypothetical protein